MRTKPSRPAPQAWDHLRHQIRQRRHRQSYRKRLPQEFWAKAVALARECGILPPARTLGLKYSSLKKHLNATVSDVSKTPQSR